MLARLLACTAAAVAAIAIVAGTASASPSPTVQAALAPRDTFFSAWSWPADSAGLAEAWNATLGDPSVVIAVVDTGVSPVPDLEGALLPGVDLVNGDDDASDDNGHGTEVATVAAARIDNGLGIAGVCGRCSILPVKALRADGTGYSSTVAQGVTWAVDHGADVVNLSLTGTIDDPALDAAIHDAVARGVVVVTAAGNAGSSDPAAGGFPAASVADAIRVGSVDASGALYSWSNRGPWVDLAAPGSVAAMLPDGTIRLGVQGTSLSAAFVSGVAGLVLSHTPGLAPAAVKTALVGSAWPAALPLVNAAGALGVPRAPQAIASKPQPATIHAAKKPAKKRVG
jgi:subtilisin family serine protease